MSGQLSLFKGKRQRGTQPPPVPEFDLHCMVADVLRRWQTPGWRWSHFPAGEFRPLPTRMRLVRMGVQSGWPDFILLAPRSFASDPRPGQAHFLELKSKYGRLSKSQFSFMEWCAHNGYPFVCCNNFADAVHHLKQWGAVRVSVSA